MSPRVAITWIGHATVLIELDGLRLLTDPVLGHRVGPLLRVARPGPSQTWSAIDCVLLSHLHADHTDLASLHRLGGAQVLAPNGSGAWLARKGITDVREMPPRAVWTREAVSVTATPAVHDQRRRPFGATATPVGYLLRGSSSAYFAGDTELFDEMAELRGRVDVALLPVSGWGPSVGAGHLDPETAARAAATIAPSVAIPIHWGTLALPWDRTSAAERSRPPREFAAHVRDYAPAVEVRLLDPGGRTEF